MAQIVSFSLDEESAELLEKLEKRTDYRNRSELIRSALQMLLHETAQLETVRGHTSAIVAVIHRQRYEEGISKVKHQFDDIVATQIHHNLHGSCLELFVTHGKAETIAEFFKALRQSPRVEYARLIAMAL